MLKLYKPHKAQAGIHRDSVGSNASAHTNQRASQTQKNLANASANRGIKPGFLRRTGSRLRSHWARRKENRLSVHRLLQLDDALLKDIGITRHDVISVQRGVKTLDALNKQSIITNRDNANWVGKIRTEDLVNILNRK